MESGGNKKFIAAADQFQADHLFGAWYFFRNLVHIHKYLKRQAQA